jgi:very-short-patch-repair endonuclease
LSPPEVLLWIRLKVRDPERPTFRRQHPISPYIADFYCSAARLVIEIDGTHHFEDGQTIRDEVRDRQLRRLGYRILRIPAAEVMADADEVADRVVQTALDLIRESRSAADAPSVTRKKERAPPPP